MYKRQAVYNEEGAYGCSRDLKRVEETFEWELKELGTDYADFGFIHCVDTDKGLSLIHISFAILTVFIAGLMVGRTPEFLGKKIEPREMKWAVVVCLATPIAILVGSGIAAALPETMDSLNNGGAHGFSEVLYAYASCGGNNGSAFAGFNANTAVSYTHLIRQCRSEWSF